MRISNQISKKNSFVVNEIKNVFGISRVRLYPKYLHLLEAGKHENLFPIKNYLIFEIFCLVDLEIGIDSKGNFVDPAASFYK